MRKIKIFISTVILFVMIINVFIITPITVNAVSCGDYDYTVLSDGTIEINKYRGTDKIVVIPDEIEQYKITKIGAYAFSNNSYISIVRIPKTISTIGEGAFYECEKLEKAIIGTGVKSIEAIAFDKCDNLKYITYLGSDVKWEKIDIDYDNDAAYSVEIERLGRRN